MNSLQQIVESVYDVKIHERRRYREHVDARKVFSTILTRRGFSFSEVARFLGKNHATILHYTRDIDFYIEHDSSFREKYFTILDRFEKKYDAVYRMSLNQLRDSYLKLKTERNELYLKVKSLESKVRFQSDKHEKLQELHELIDNHITPSKSEECLIQFNRVINGLR